LSNVSTAPGNGVLLFCHIDIDLFMINALFCSSPLKGCTGNEVNEKKKKKGKGNKTG